MMMRRNRRKELETITTSNIDFRRVIQDPLKMKTKRNLLEMKKKNEAASQAESFYPSWTIKVRGREKHAKMKTNGEESQSAISSTKLAKTRRTSTYMRYSRR